MKLTDLLANNRALMQWQRELNKSTRTLFTGIQGTIKTLLMATAFDNQPDKYIIITDNQYHASELYNDLSEFVGEEKVFQYFSDDNIFAEYAVASKERLAYRLDALSFYKTNRRMAF